MAVHLYCFHVSLGERFQASTLHTHPHHEFYLNVGGAGHQWTDAAAFPMRPGDFFHFPAGQAHGAGALRDAEPTDGYVLNMDEGLLSDGIDADREALVTLRYLSREAREDRNRIRMSPASVRRLRSILRSMADEHRRKEPGFRCLSKIRVLELFLTVLRDPRVGPRIQDGLQPTGVEERLGDVLRFIDTHYMEKITVAAMAERACLSRSHFHAVFRQETGYSLVEYVNTVRIRKACHLLETTTLPILQVALACGFPNLSHFYHLFAAQTGRTPKAVRATSA